MEQDSSPTYVDLICVAEKQRLRIRIVTPGYFTQANCQFPKAIRKENGRYRVKTQDVTLITQRGKYFYSVRRNAQIQVLTEQETLELDLAHLKVFEDQDTEECAICLSEKKDTIFYPCGHYYTCHQCAEQLDLCPICRQPITGKIDRSQIDV